VVVRVMIKSFRSGSARYHPPIDGAVKGGRHVLHG
jgi:hypothetical protein